MIALAERYETDHVVRDEMVPVLVLVEPPVPARRRNGWVSADRLGRWSEENRKIALDWMIDGVLIWQFMSSGSWRRSTKTYNPDPLAPEYIGRGTRAWMPEIWDGCAFDGCPGKYGGDEPYCPKHRSARARAKDRAVVARSRMKNRRRG